MNSELKVTVSGKAGSGKSAVAQLLAEFLSANGFSTVLVENEHRPRDVDSLNMILTEIKPKVSIEVQSKATRLNLGSMVHPEVDRWLELKKQANWESSPDNPANY